MVTITIGTDERTINNYDENWISQQINSRRNDSMEVCVRVSININDADMILSTPACIKHGGNRTATSLEKDIIELWDKRGLNQKDFTAGNLISFLKQLRKYL